MIMHGAVLAGYANPVDGAVGVDVLGDDLVLGVDHAFEAEGIGAAAAGDGVVTCLNAAVSAAKICVLPSWAATISPASEREQHVVADTAVHPVGAEAADQKVVTVSAGQAIVAGATPKLVVAAAADERVVPAMPATASSPPPPFR